MAPVFVADPADAVATALLDGLTALYHRPSGQTHVLAAPAPEVLDLLAGAPADAATLLARLAERFALDDAAEASVAARLAELEGAGLVSRA